MLEEMKVDLIDGLRLKFVPDSDALEQCFELGLRVAKDVQKLCG